MNEQSQDSNPLPPTPTMQDVVALIKKMHGQLVALERKIDTLISQSPARPFGEKRFSKPYRPFGRPQYSSHREHDGAPGEKKDFGQGHHFQRRHSSKKSGFGHKKKPFYHSQHKT